MIDTKYIVKEIYIEGKTHWDWQPNGYTFWIRVDSKGDAINQIKIAENGNKTSITFINLFGEEIKETI